jgi:hypothetical protein
MPTASRCVLLTLAALVMGTGLVGCSTPGKNPEFTVYDPKDQRIRDRYGTILGTEGVTLLSTEKPALGELDGQGGGSGGAGGGGGIGVNAYLWRGTLDTISFMPLASADPFGGLIITDWYEPPESPNERLKLQVQIRDQSLRADGLKVSVFRQVRNGSEWTNAAVDPATATSLEDKILTRARELRVSTVAAEG